MPLVIVPVGLHLGAEFAFADPPRKIPKDSTLRAATLWRCSTQQK